MLTLLLLPLTPVEIGLPFAQPGSSAGELRDALPVGCLARLDSAAQGPVRLTLFDLEKTGAERQYSCGTLHDYANKAEPGVATVARTLNVLKRRPRWLPGNSGALVLVRGPDFTTGQVVESLLFYVIDGELCVNWTDGLHRRRQLVPLRAAYESVVDLLGHAARVAAWGVDEVPLEPASLFEAVPVGRCRTYEVVETRNIPAYARVFFEREFRGHELSEGVFHLHTWLDYLVSD